MKKKNDSIVLPTDLFHNLFLTDKIAIMLFILNLTDLIYPTEGGIPMKILSILFNLCIDYRALMRKIGKIKIKRHKLD